MSTIKYPSGFRSFGQYKQFSEATQAAFVRAGFNDTRFYMQGSAVTGFNVDGIAFDIGRVSDFDIAVVSSTIVERARTLGIVSGSGRIIPLGNQPEAAVILRQLGLFDAQQQLSRLSNRPVSFMIFETIEKAKSTKTSMFMPARF